MNKKLSSLFAAIALAGFVACNAPPDTTEILPAKSKTAAQQQATLQMAGIHDTATVKNIRLTEHGLTRRDYTLTNPYNLAPADKVLAMAIEEEIAALEKDQVLVIISSEIHSYPSHHISHIGTLTHLADMRDKNPDDSRRRFLFAFEQPFNSLANYMRVLYDLPVPEHLQYKMQERDPDYYIAIRAALGGGRSNAAPLSREKVLQAVLHRHIPAIFNDASIAMNRDSIDPHDPLMAEIKEALRGDFQHQVDRKMNVRKPVGIAYRNSVMVKRGLAEAKKRGIRIVFQQCGLGHVFGNESFGLRFKHSLASLYKKAGARVLVDFKLGRQSGLSADVNPQAWIDFPNTVIRRGLDNSSFSDKDSLLESFHLDLLIKSYSDQKEIFDFDDPVPSYNSTKNGLKLLLKIANEESRNPVKLPRPDSSGAPAFQGH